MVNEMSAQPVGELAPPAGYNEDLARADKELARLERRRQDHPGDIQCRVTLLYRMYHRTLLTGRISELDGVETGILESIQEFGPREDLCLLKANLDLHLYRLAETRRDLEMAPLLSGRFEGRVLLADIDFQEGRYESARMELERLIEERREWDNLARLAYWKSKFGQADEADALYTEAEDELTAKQMRSYAWLEVHRGLLDFKRGRYADARIHYQRAEEGYPGYWHTSEHIAELLAAEQKFDEAISILEDVAARTGKPELLQTIGELYIVSGRKERAQPWLDQAHVAYLDSVRRGGVHYFHHLADLYVDVRENPEEALRWARRDFELRSNFSTQAALAWVLYRTGLVHEGLKYMHMALASGVQDARVFSTAAELFATAGQPDAAAEFRKTAFRINPVHDNFHVHHS